MIDFYAFGDELLKIASVRSAAGKVLGLPAARPGTMMRHMDNLKAVRKAPSAKMTPGDIAGGKNLRTAFRKSLGGKPQTVRNPFFQG